MKKIIIIIAIVGFSYSSSAQADTTAAQVLKTLKAKIEAFEEFKKNRNLITGIWNSYDIEEGIRKINAQINALREKEILRLYRKYKELGGH